MEPSTIFILSLIAPFIFCRALLYARPKLFERPLVKRMTGLQIHHYHYGLALAMIGVVLILLNGKQLWAIVLLGIGMGFLLDETTTVMLVPSESNIEFQIYKNSFKSTAILVGCVSLLILILRRFS